jgi:hypothetical protein
MSRLKPPPPPVEPAAVQQGLEQLFTPQFLHEALAARPSKYRERSLSIEVVLFALLHFVLQRLPSFLELLRHLRIGAVASLGKVRTSSSALYKRLRKLPHEIFLRLLNDTTSALVAQHPLLAHAPALVSFAPKVYAIDDTTLEGAMETLAGRLSSAIDLGTGLLAEVLYNPDSATNEKNHIRALVQSLGCGALYVFDCGYVSFPFLDWMTQHGCYLLTRLPTHVTFDTVYDLYQGSPYRDRIVYLGKHRADRAACPVRLVELLIERTWYRFVTNRVDPDLLPAPLLWSLYGRRWSIEKCFAVLKGALGMAYLQMCDLNGVLSQLWSTLAVYQVLQTLRLKIAQQAGWEPDDVSWEILMRTLARYPRGASLLEWLLLPEQLRWLKKMGVRPRRHSHLPAEVLEQCQGPPGLPTGLLLQPRKARQGTHHRPRTKELTLLVAGLQRAQPDKP